MVTTLRDVRRIWSGRFIEAARAHGLRTVGGYGYVDDGQNVTSVAIVIGALSDPLRVRWWVEGKPIALDDVLWEAFLPDLEASPAKRRSLRVNGAFAAPGLELGRGHYLVPQGDDPSATVSAVLQSFDDLCADFARSAPTVADFVALARAGSGEAPPRPPGQLRGALALIAAGRTTEAFELLRGELARGERGPMIGPDGSAYQVLLNHYGAREQARTAERHR